MNDLSPGPFRTSVPAPHPQTGKAAPRTDVGTILIHWIASIACIINLVTSLLLNTDHQFSVVWLAISPVFAHGKIRSWHIISCLGLTVASTTNSVIMQRSVLM